MVDPTQLLAMRQAALAPASGLPGYPQSRLLNTAHGRWLEARLAAEMPSWSDLRHKIDEPLGRSAILLDVLPEPLDFRYAEIGSQILAISNGNYTGRLMSELPHQRPPSKIWDHCAAATDARAPVKGMLPYVGRSRAIASIYHIVLPLADDGETVDRLFVCVDPAPARHLADSPGTPSRSD